MDVDLRKTAAEHAADLASGATTSVALTQAHLDRIAAVDGAVHAFLHVDAEGALAQAASADERRAEGATRSPLDGVPIAVKDVLATQGLPTTCGSRILEGWVPPYDATVVARIKAAGLPILGKTNMDEFAMGSSTEHSAYGPTRNPWDLDRIPGGSGGGSAAAVASFEAPLALGTDTGGSIRQPGAVTGTVGVKPTYGSVSRYGLVALANSLDQVGPVTRTVLDSALLHEIIGGHDPRDSTSVRDDVPDLVAAARLGAQADLSGVRVGVITELSGDGWQDGVMERFQESVDLLVGAGAEVVEVSCPTFVHALATYYLILPAEASSNLAKFDAMRYGLRVLPEGIESPSAEDVMRATRDAGFGDEVKRRIILGTYALSSGYYDAYYGQAQKVRTLITRDFDAAFAQADVLLSPTAPTTAFKLGEKLDDPLAMYLNDLATIPANLSGVPGISVPGGLAAEDGLPVGVQVLAPALADDRVYRVGAALEAAAHREVGRSAARPGPCSRRRDLVTDAAATLVAFDDVLATYDPALGLEVHVELNTNTKMFCGCPAVFGGDPNTQVCPTCLGLPGAMPVVNGKAVESAIRIGLALNCEIAEWCRFARKNYFYPDMPKNFQTSQYDEPIAFEGWMDVDLVNAAGETETYRVEIERAHMEEDTGKSLHVGGATGRIHGADYSLVDYNRAGIPLIEIVTKPIVGAGAKAPEVARAYVQQLRDLIVALGVSEARMDQGNLRADVNLSLSPKGSGVLGTRTETKNVNSFRSVERAVRYEMQRHAAILDGGGSILQETRHWHEDTGVTTSGREKSDAEDYRYFPEPDLVPVAPSREWVEELRGTLPENPTQKRARLQADWGFTDLEMRDTVGAGAFGLVEETVAAGAPPQAARKWWLGELARSANESGKDIADLGVTPADVAAVQALVDARTINDKLARQVFEGLLAGEGTPSEIVEKRGLAVVSDDGALGAAVDKAIAENPEIADKIRDGKVAAAGALIGAVMKEMRGQADAGRVRELVLEKLA